MVKKLDKAKARAKRHQRVRNKINGTADCPRLNVFRSSKHIYAQVIDDVNGVTLCSASSMSKDFEGNGGNKEGARKVGLAIAEAAKKAGGKVIGVDVDQKAIIDGDYGEGMTVTSATKGLRPTTINALTDIIVGGKWADYAGKIVTLGLVSGDDPSANYVQLAETTQFGDGFTKDDYAALVKGMFDGTITVSNDTSKLPDVTNVTIDDQGKIKG